VAKVQLTAAWLLFHLSQAAMNSGKARVVRKPKGRQQLLTGSRGILSHSSRLEKRLGSLKSGAGRK